MNKWVVDTFSDVPVESITAYQEEMFAISMATLIVVVLILAFK